MDKLYVSVLSELFAIVALAAAKKYGVHTNSTHLDSSSFHVHGKYENNLSTVAFISGEFNPSDPQWSDVEETVS